MEWNWGKLTDSDAWKSAMANLLRKGEDVGQYIAKAPSKAGQAIVEAGQRQGALMNKAFDPTGKNLIRDPQAANEAGMNLLAGPLGFAPVGMFVGPSATGWSAENAFKAAQMEKAGKTPEEIWQATGTARGLDNNWRQEISDVNATSKNIPKYFWQKKEQNLSNLLEHPELFQNYPEIQNLKTTLDKSLKNEAELNPRGISYGSTNSKELTPSLLHEIQHGIQQHEGWATGSTPTAKLSKAEESNWVNTVFQDLKSNVNNADFSDKELMEYAKKLALSPEGKFERYNRLSGEVESRLTEKRAKLTDEQRKASFPFKQGENALEIDPNIAIIKNGEEVLTRKQLLEKLLNK